MGGVSNYNLESFEGYEGRIIGGPEVVNGTGSVQLKFFENAGQDTGDMVFFTLTADECLDLARWLSRHAFEAMRAKWSENNLMTG